MIHEIINYASTFPIIATWSVKLVPTGTSMDEVLKKGKKKKEDIFSWKICPLVGDTVVDIVMEVTWDVMCVCRRR